MHYRLGGGVSSKDSAIYSGDNASKKSESDNLNVEI
jgi:hypothetical protein